MDFTTCSIKIQSRLTDKIDVARVRFPFKFQLLTFIFLAPIFWAQAGSINPITYQGRILKPDGTPLETSTNFRFVIRSPDNCILWQEDQVIDLTNSLGAVSALVGNGANTAAGSHTFADVFNNSRTLTGLSGCDVGTDFVPGLNDDRTLHVSFNDGTGSQSIPTLTVKSVPFSKFASLAQQVYALFGRPFATGNPTTTGQVISYNATTQSWEVTTPSTGGTVTQVTAGAGLAGGSITLSGTLSLAPSGVTAGSIGSSNFIPTLLVDSFGRITGMGSAAISIPSALSSINGLTASDQVFVVGSAGTLAAFSSAGSTNTLNIPMASSAGVAGGLLSKLDYDSFASAASLAANGTISAARGGTGLDGSAATNGQLLIGNGSGFTLGTLTAGSNITITNSAGGITIASSNGGGSVTQVNSGTGLTGGPINGVGTLSLADTAVTPGGYGAANYSTTLSVDQQGRLTAAGSTLIAISADQMTGGTLAFARLPVSGVTAGVFSSSSYIPTFTVDSFGRLVSVGSNAISFPALQWTNVALGVNYASGSVGIGQASPATMLDVNGAIRIANDGTACAAGLAGALRYNAGFVEYCNGTGPGWQTLGISGAGIQSLNGLTGNAQLFAVGSSGTLAAFTSGGSLHTLNIPLASTAGAAGGLLSNMDYLTLMNGTIPAGRVSDLDAAQITSGTFAQARLGVVGRAAGGTGLDTSSASAGQILIGTGSGLALGTLSAGTNININNQNGTITISSSNGGGTVTQVNTGSGLSGGPFSAVGTITLADTAVTAGAYGNAAYSTTMTVDQQGRLTAAGSTLIAINGSQITGGTISLAQVPDLDASKLVSGTLANARLPLSGAATGNVGSSTYIPTLSIDAFGRITSYGSAAVSIPTAITSINGLTASEQIFVVGTSGTMAAFSSAGSTNTLNIPMASAAGVAGGLLSKIDYDSFASGTSLAANGTISAGRGGTGLDGSSAALGQLLIGNGSGYSLGTLISGSGISIVNQAGSITISANNSGSVTQVNTGAGLVGGPISGVGTISLGTTGVVAGSVGSSNFIPQITFDSYGRITAVGSTSVAINVSALSGTLSVSQGGTGLDASSAANGSLLIGNGSGFGLGTLVGANGILLSSGAGSVGISTNAQVSNTINTLITRDGSGNFAAGQATLDSLRLNNAGSQVTISNPVGSNYSLLLPANIGTPGQVLSTDGTGSLSWVTAGSGVSFPLLSTTLGSAGIAAYSFSGDADTGLYSPGSDQLAFATNGTLRIHFGADGKIGFGGAPDASVGYRFLANVNDEVMVVQNNSASDVSGIQFRDDGGNQRSIIGYSNALDRTILDMGGSQDFVITSQFVTQEKLRITNGGSVGIGVTVPTAKLDLQGPAWSGSDLQIARFGADVNPGDGLFLAIENTDAVNRQAGLDFNSQGTRRWGIGSDRFSAGNNDFYIRDWVNAADRMYINAAGSIGIGNTSPLARLDVEGSIRGTSQIFAGAGTAQILAPGSGNYSFSLPNSIGTAGQVLSTDGTGALSWSSVPSNGGIFLAASTTEGTPGFAFNSDPDVGLFNPGANSLGISTAGLERFRITSGGSFGFGTTNPVYFLHARKDQNTSTQSVLQNFSTGASAFTRIAASSDTSSANLTSYSSGNAASRSGIALATSAELIFAASSKSFIGNSAAVPMYFVTSDLVRGVLDGNGNMGLGTQAVSSGSRLEVTGGAITAGDGGQLRMNEPQGSGTNWVSFRAPASLIQNYSMILPGTIGTPGQVLTTDGTGSLSWSSPSGSVSFPLLSTSTGTVGSPAYSFSNDPDTGVYSSGPGRLALAVDGTIGLRILRSSGGNSNGFEMSVGGFGSYPTLTTQGQTVSGSGAGMAISARNGSGVGNTGGPLYLSAGGGQTGGGSLTIRGGDGSSGTSASGGDVFITAGSSDAPFPYTSTGGNLTLSSGFAWGGGPGSASGDVVLQPAIGGNLVFAGIATSISLGESKWTGTNSVSISAPFLSSNYSLFLPGTLGASGASLVTTGGGTLGWASTAPSVIIVADEKTSGTDGGTCTSGSWVTRTLNTTRANSISGASLAADVITLPAGTYEVDLLAPAHQVNMHQARLYNVTGAAVLVLGSSENSGATDSTLTSSRILGRFTLTATSNLRLEHRCSTTKATNGFGISTGWDTEVYSLGKIQRIQ